MGRSPFAEKSILVTGASSGLGRAMALDLAKAGAKVGIIARRANLLDELATEIRAIGGQVHSACADVADWESLRAAVQQIEMVCGPAEFMIANAGLGAPSPLDAESHVREIGAMIRTNTMGWSIRLPPCYRECWIVAAGIWWPSPVWRLISLSRGKGAIVPVRPP